MIGVNEMKRLNKFITSVLIMTIVSAFALMNTYAELQTVWNADFSGMSDLQVPAGTITEKNSDFSAEIKNGSLEVKSDSVCYFQIEDSNSLNSSANSHGITLQLRGSDPFITKRAEPITFQGVRYDYSGHGNIQSFSCLRINPRIFFHIEGRIRQPHFMDKPASLDRLFQFTIQ